MEVIRTRASIAMVAIGHVYKCTSTCIFLRLSFESQSINFVQPIG